MSCDDHDDGCLTVPRPCAAANIWVWAILECYRTIRVVRPCKDLDSREIVWDNLKIINGKEASGSTTVQTNFQVSLLHIIVVIQRWWMENKYIYVIIQTL